MSDYLQIVDQVNRIDIECPTEQPPNNSTEISNFVLSSKDDDALAAKSSDDVKPIIKHKTSDLGKDTNLHTNEATKVCPKNGLYNGLEPDFIIGATEVDDKLMFLVAWKNSDDVNLIESSKINEISPQIVIKYFEKRLLNNQPA